MESNSPSLDLIEKTKNLYKYFIDGMNSVDPDEAEKFRKAFLEHDCDNCNYDDSFDEQFDEIVDSFLEG